MGAIANRRDHTESGARKLLGEVLVELGVLTSADLEEAVKRASSRKMRVGELLVEEKRISDFDLARALAIQQGVEFRELAQFEAQAAVVGLIPEKVARRFLILPLEISEGQLKLAVYNPIDAEMLDLVGHILRMPVTLVISPREQLVGAIDRSYRTRKSVEQIVAQLQTPKPAKLKDARATPGSPSPANQVSIEALVNRFLDQGVQDLASDIHVDPAEDSCRVRVRIDGVLREMHRYPFELHNQVVSRLKVLSGLDISERRSAQDGRFQYRVEEQEVDIRISTLPTIRGEKAVLRLLNKRRRSLTRPEIGMSATVSEHVGTLVRKPHGIVFVTGPTGSGKTTTLYSMLGLINGIERNIITVEDPVEFTFDIIHQVQINEKAGVSFASILKNILRQDPDVLMIGEVRDQETAEIAIRSALTGHLVLSTLHTNDAVSAISRLIDMKVEPFLLSSSLIGVVAQRLVRKLCDSCAKPGQVSERERAAIGPELVAAGAKIRVPAGCEKCHGTGYRGRMPIFEMMKVDGFVKQAIAEGRSEIEITAHLRKGGFRTLREDGVDRVLAGLTSVDEVLKATG